jgi:hypothetical protein
VVLILLLASLVIITLTTRGKRRASHVSGSCSSEAEWTMSRHAPSTGLGSYVGYVSDTVAGIAQSV